MRRIRIRAVAASLVLAGWPCVALVGGSEDATMQEHVFPPLERSVKVLRAESSRIPAERQAALRRLADWIATRLESGEKPRLLFVCTHNSRRSHMAQVWARLASRLHGVNDVETYSGGTEATAFNPRAVAALEGAGFRAERVSEGENPRVRVWSGSRDEGTVAFSKLYGDEENPSEGFAAVMTCAEADEACPFVPGASARFSLPYEDPKAFDGSPQEAEAYDARSSQIAREMLYAFSLVASR